MKSKSALTTHQTAAIIKAHPSMVIRWYDRGVLTGWRTPGGHRRIDPVSVANYFRERGREIPSQLEEFLRHGALVADQEASQGVKRLSVLWVSPDTRALLRISRQARDLPPHQVVTFMDSLFEALVETGRAEPDVVLLSTEYAGHELIRACAAIRGSPDWPSAPQVLLLKEEPELSAAEADAGANGCVPPAPLGETMDRLEGLLSDDDS